MGTMDGMDENTRASGKGGYHHGDLRNALLGAATQLAREGGPEAVVLRAAARLVGVSPTAAYRHFAGQADLLDALKEHSQQLLVEAMERAAAEGEDGEPDSWERRPPEERLRALGRGYVRYALAEPGLFRACFCRVSVTGDGAALERPERGHWMYRSFQLLVETLDAIAATGRMPERRRPGAEMAAWSSVHGLALLLLDGPLGELADEQREVVTERCLDTVVAGLTAP